MMIKLAVCFFVILGTFFIVMAAIGILRFPDVYTRAHAASKSATLGILFVLFGVFLYFWLVESLLYGRLLLAIIFLFVTSPIGAHYMLRSAYFSDVRASDRTVHDELAAEKARKEAETK